MIHIFKRKSLQILAPVDGEVIAIADVPDEVFAKKILGEGIAIKPSSGEYFSPIEGDLVTVHPHAFGIRHRSGTQLLLHVGIDTVNLNGEGFEILCKEKAHVSIGDPLVKVDLKKVRPKVPSLISPIVIIPDSIEGKKLNYAFKTNTDENRQVKHGDLLITIE